MPLDSTTWAALAFLLTALGAGYSYVAWRRGGVTAGVRGVAWTLLPVAAWLTGTLRLAGNVVDAVTSWAAHLVFDPVTWLGIILGGVSVVLFGTTSVLRRRGIGTGKRATRQLDAAREKPGKQDRGRQDKGKQDKLVDDEVSAILRRRGIS